STWERRRIPIDELPPCSRAQSRQEYSRGQDQRPVYRDMPRSMQPPAPPEAHRPEQLREAVARYVTALHRSYRAQARLLSPALQGSLPLMSAEQFQVLAAGAGSLHIIATRQPLPPRQDPEVEIQD